MDEKLETDENNSMVANVGSSEPTSDSFDQTTILSEIINVNDDVDVDSTTVEVNNKPNGIQQQDSIISTVGIFFCVF